MLTRLAVRLATGIAVIAGVVTLTFVLLHTAPGDPAELLLGPAATPAQVAAQRHTLGLDRPLPIQYATWVAAFVRGEWGASIASGRPVRTMLATAWPLTAELVAVSLFFTYLFGIVLGAVQAARSGSRLDTA
ncbi:MAG TPA: ABC transporter permease, partial [Gemmatimonadales bacterium]|nr:ABC transporter permease [Gemmatimonadales bacterium]